MCHWPLEWLLGTVVHPLDPLFRAGAHNVLLLEIWVADVTVTSFIGNCLQLEGTDSFKVCFPQGVAHG